MVIRILLMLIGLTGLEPVAMGGQWELISNENGVKVYSMEEEGTDFVAFRGVKDIKAPFDRVMYVMTNRSEASKKEWVAALKAFRVLERSKTRSVIYTAFDAPWPVSDRDFVNRIDYSYDQSKGLVDLHIRSVKHKKAPETVGVRARTLRGFYQIKVLDEHRTRVQVEIVMDPGGLLPAWLVNMIQKGWPEKTLNDLAKRTAVAPEKRQPLATQFMHEYLKIKTPTRQVKQP